MNSHDRIVLHITRDDLYEWLADNVLELDENGEDQIKGDFSVFVSHIRNKLWRDSQLAAETWNSFETAVMRALDEEGIKYE